MTEGVHACIKCGRSIGPHESICSSCNRAQMATPSASQYHGTLAVAIIAGVVALAIAGTLALRGVGPYGATAESFSLAANGELEVTVVVENHGTRAGRATCQIVVLDVNGRRVASRRTATPSIEGGQSIVLVERLSGVRGAPERVGVDCA